MWTVTGEYNRHVCLVPYLSCRVVCLNAGLKHPEEFGGSYLDVNSEEKVHAIGYSREGRLD